MKRSGTSAYALQLPERSTKVVAIRGSERIERVGIYIAVIGKHRRMVYQQLDGKVELADACSCKTDWQPDFEIARSIDCVIDAHRQAARDSDWGAA